MALALEAFAKLNLDLRLLGRRDDGQHDIVTRFQAISLHDVIEVERSDRTTIEVTGLEAPSDSQNLVLRAAASLEDAAGRPLPARWRLVKRIPSGAGLGGGSSDAASALRALRDLFQLDVDLPPLAAVLGADVPFFLRGGAAVGEGRGERLRPVAAPAAWFAIAWPGLCLSTAAVYAAWDDQGGDGENHLLRGALLVEPRLREFAERLGPGWRMTGSGSAFFREFADREPAQRACAGLDCWTAVARSVEAWG
ncbi:MAG: 4-(cytidine 5'-diphospho)-2-C-methyl-D-erythritol kinase [Candidatus Dormibacteraceae bacterium]